MLFGFLFVMLTRRGGIALYSAVILWVKTHEKKLERQKDFMRRKATKGSAKCVENWMFLGLFIHTVATHPFLCVWIYLLTNYWLTRAPFTLVRVKFLHKQKLVRFHLAFTRDRRNWTNFWTAKCASLGPLFFRSQTCTLSRSKICPGPQVPGKRKVEPWKLLFVQKFVQRRVNGA